MFFPSKSDETPLKPGKKNTPISINRGLQIRGLPLPRLPRLPPKKWGLQAIPGLDELGRPAQESDEEDDQEEAEARDPRFGKSCWYKSESGFPVVR